MPNNNFGPDYSPAGETRRQAIERKMALGVMAAPQWAEVIMMRVGATGSTPAGPEYSLPYTFVDRQQEEGPNQTYGDGPNPASVEGERRRATYIVELPPTGAVIDGLGTLMPEVTKGYQFYIDGLWFNYVRHTGRDSAKQTVRVVYSYPDYTRRPAMRPNAPANFNRKL